MMTRHEERSKRPTPEGPIATPDSPPESLSRQRVKEIQEALAQSEMRRQEIVPERFRVCVDGKEVRACDRDDRSVKFAIPVGVDLIQVYGSDRIGEALLATHVLSYSEYGDIDRSSGRVTLRGCGRVTIQVNTDADEPGTANCSVSLVPNWDWRVLVDAAIRGLPEMLGQSALAYGFAEPEKPRREVDSKVVTWWRRRMAAIRAFHVFALSSALVGGASVLLKSIGNTTPDQEAQAVAAKVLLATVGLLFAQLCWSRWYWGRHAYKARLQPGELPVEELLRDRIRLLTREPHLPVHFYRIPRSKSKGVLDQGAARIIRTGEGLHISIDLDGLAKLDEGDRTMPVTSAIVFHEVGHYLQWHTTLGLWTFKASQTMGILGLVLGCAAIIGGVGAVKTIMEAPGATAIPLELLRAFFIIVVATTLMLGIFLGGRYWRRVSEYNCDFTAVVAGYGVGIEKALRRRQSGRGPLRALLSMYPSAAERADRVAEFHCESLADRTREARAFGPEAFKIRFLDYAYGGLVYVASIVLGFEIAVRLVVNLARQWGIIH
jgi:hypothetical protein